MTAQRAGTGLDDGYLCTRSFVLYPGVFEDRWEYLTQQPPDRTTLDEKPQAEFMFGGGIEMGTPSFFDAVYYGKWRGGESADKDDVYFERGRDKKAWSGILAISADGHYPPLAVFLQRRSEGREWIAAAIRAREWFTPEGVERRWERH
ncbi:hypothetical protein ARMGADRAFT_1092725 [Armillaria gallica]|uniref:Uncharacterized protein n=1 Tax=Armillaria gallica TaxID=47427 RepID=A0A2H3CN69_ARMGA|nr:hypothetical protein ARMGADRAFT_1092725 [Armillaria gallica]